MPYCAIIFDRDGVLTEFDLNLAATYFQRLLPLSIDELGNYWRRWGEAAGFPRTVAEEIVFWDGFWDFLAEELTLSSFICSQLKSVNYTDFLKPFPDVRLALNIVRHRGLQVGVLSNFSLATLPDSLKAVGLADLVDVACAATVIGAAKPQPEAYLSVTKALGVTPEMCLFFDDEIACVEGATAVGMQAYLVDRRRTNHDLDAHVVCDLLAVDLILDKTSLVR